MAVAEAKDTVFAPSICLGARVIVAQIVPGVPVRAVVLPHRAPGALAEIGSPALPVNFAISVLQKAFVFFTHEESSSSNRRLAISTRLTNQRTTDAHRPKTDSSM